MTGGAAGSGELNIHGTLTNPTNTSQTATYSVTPLSGNCTGSNFIVTITVRPTPTVTNSPLTQTICSGGSTTLVTLTSDVSGTTFAWTATATAGVSGFSTSGTSTIPVQTISTTELTQGTVTYAITPTASYAMTLTSVGCTGSVTNYTVLVDPIVSFGTVSSGDESICIGGNPSNISLSVAPTGGAGTFNYQWYYKDGISDCPEGTVNTGWNPITDATGSSYDPPTGLTASELMP